MLAVRRERDKSRSAEKLAKSELAVSMNFVLFQNRQRFDQFRRGCGRRQLTRTNRAEALGGRGPPSGGSPLRYKLVELQRCGRTCQLGRLVPVARTRVGIEKGRTHLRPTSRVAEGSSPPRFVSSCLRRTIRRLTRCRRQGRYDGAIPAGVID